MSAQAGRRVPLRLRARVAREVPVVRGQVVLVLAAPVRVAPVRVVREAPVVPAAVPRRRVA